MKKNLFCFFIGCFFVFTYGKDFTLSKTFFDERYVLGFEIDGNFVDTEKETTLYVYLENPIIDNDIKAVVVSDISNSIVYQLPSYFSLDFTQKRNFNNSPLKEIGKEIKINEMVYGYVADINNNGLEEIYLYQLSGMSFYPIFYEFCSKEKTFKSILNYDGAGTILLLENLDIDKKQLKFRGYAVGPYQENQEDITYTWNDDTGIYDITERIVYERNENGDWVEKNRYIDESKSYYK